MSVTIGIDPHEATPTAVAIDRDDQPIAKLGVVAERCQSERLLAGAASFGFARTWAIEPASGWGKLLARQLVGAGESARVRLGGSTMPGKNDSNDALWTAITGLRQGWLRTVRVEDHNAVIRLLIDRYDGLVSVRTPATCRLHVVRRELIAGGAPRRLSANRAAKLRAQCPSRWSGRRRAQTARGRSTGRRATPRPGHRRDPITHHRCCRGLPDQSSNARSSSPTSMPPRPSTTSRARFASGSASHLWTGATHVHDGQGQRRARPALAVDPGASHAGQVHVGARLQVFT